ncbi:MAG: helix-turn-helix domain-containing protein [Bacteroides sp.]|nr:helix-turn-helix domain-containing protein [Bacillota bacterium]MCM1393518.1 helix-turn-helix domain-containing protein [[Eubacterium] siraeum]MCM1455111.1 helix-turn-helix domain-containing protein [Bacteroides sp.]
MLFTQRFNEAIKQSSISQVQLANQIGISKQCISDFKSGKSFPSIQTLFAICNALNISSDYLLGLSDY